MNKLFIFLLLFSPLAAFAQEYVIASEKINVTSEGILINLCGDLKPVYSVSYQGNGIYAAEYYGQCGRCGWALDPNGKCTNRNCNQYGPRERD